MKRPGRVRAVGDGVLKRRGCAYVFGVLRQMLEQEFDLLQVDLTGGLMQGGQRLDGDVGGDVRVAVAVAADPGGIAQNRRQF